MNIEASNINGINSVEVEEHHAEIKSFGFWIYLMSDLILFSVLFATFAVVGHNYAGSPGPKQLFHLPYLFTETMLLLFSSMSYGLAIIAMHNGNKKMVLTGLVITFLLGLGFVSMEINEFYGMILAGNGPDKSSFLSSFFTLVGTHGLHVTFGLIWIAVMIRQVISMDLTSGVRSRLMRLSLFWHFLDIIWIGVFTFVYLMGYL